MIQFVTTAFRDMKTVGTVCPSWPALCKALTRGVRESKETHQDVPLRHARSALVGTDGVESHEGSLGGLIDDAGVTLVGRALAKLKGDGTADRHL